MKNTSIMFSGLLATLALAGCANWGETEPVLRNQPQAYGQPTVLKASNEKPVTVNRPQENLNAKREIASFKADLDALAEEQKMLTARIMGLEQDLARKDQQIKELQSLLDAMDKRFADVDSSWRDRMKELSNNIDREREARQREQKQFTQAVTKVIADQNSGNDGNEQYAKYVELTVQKGDTLGKIAAAAKISVAELKRINKLNSDIIRENQKLKVPVKK